jgi:hypothetical protein
LVMVSDKKQLEDRLKPGRKPLVEGSVTVPVTMKLTPMQKEKLFRLGGAPWVRDRIDRAKEPTPKE